MNPRLITGVAIAAVLLAIGVFSVSSGTRTPAPAPAPDPTPTEPVAAPASKRVVFTRPSEPVPAPSPAPTNPPDLSALPLPDPNAVPMFDQIPQPAEPVENKPTQTLADLPHEERAVVQRAARIALGETMEACEAHVPEGLMAIAVVTLDEKGLVEMAPIEGGGEPLQSPALNACLDDTLWSQDWPTTSGPQVRFGLQLQGPAPLGE